LPGPGPPGTTIAEARLRIDTLAILGAGDAGIAAARLATLAGVQVRLWDPSEAALRAGVLLVRLQLERAVAEGAAPAEHRQQILDGVLATTDLEEAVEGADVVLEAAPGPPGPRRDAMIRAAALSPGTPLLTAGAIDDLAPSLPDPSVLAGLRLGDRPGERRPEPVAGPRSSPRAVEAASDLAALLSSAAVVHSA
jgi:ornithine cyclodeaminase/alanine dehydrogenase-like protein (mu-crystallin family)